MMKFLLAGVSLVAVATVAHAQPPAGTPWALVWSDDFTTSNLDTTKWWTRYPNSGASQYLPSNNEQEIFEEGQDGEPNHVMLNPGVALTAYGPRASDGRYPSGMLRSKQVFNFGGQTPIYIEVSAQIPNATGSWPAIWFAAEPTNPNGGAPWPPEMDLAEFMNNATTNSKDLHMGLQWNGVVPGPWNGSEIGWGPVVPKGWTWVAPGGVTQWDTATDFSADYHTYGILITPGAAGVNINPATGQPTHNFSYYVDGFQALYGSYDFQIGADGSCCYNAELLIDLAVGGNGGGTPAPAQFPATFDIKYVHVYAAPPLVPSTIGTNYMPSGG